MSRNQDPNQPPDRAPEAAALAGGVEPDPLAQSPKLEAALREAAEAVERHAAGPPGGDAGAEGAASSAATEQIEELSARLVEERDRYIRLQADFDNFRKRTLKEHRDALHYGHQNVVKDLLSVVDNLERAIEHARKSAGGSKDLESLLQGVELVHREFLMALQKNGVESVEAHGKPFDPAVHEAMAQSADGSVAPNTVIDVFQKGYLLRDRLLRPARVVVAREPGRDDEGEASRGSENGDTGGRA